MGKIAAASAILLGWEQVEFGYKFKKEQMAEMVIKVSRRGCDSDRRLFGVYEMEISLRTGKLGPESCGWHYVEGLLELDNPQIAIVWDKVVLGHNGERIERGGHEILYLDGSHRVISEQNWSESLQEQKQLWQIESGRLSN